MLVEKWMQGNRSITQSTSFPQEFYHHTVLFWIFLFSCEGNENLTVIMGLNSLQTFRWNRIKHFHFSHILLAVLKSTMVVMYRGKSQIKLLSILTSLGISGAVQQLAPNNSTAPDSSTLQSYWTRWNFFLTCPVRAETCYGLIKCSTSVELVKLSYPTCG